MTITYEDLAREFAQLHKEANSNQTTILRFIAENGSALGELPTGSGKTPVGLAYLMAHRARGAKRLYYVVPTKALVQQVCDQYPKIPLIAAFGRGEYECLYYGPEASGDALRANEIPCSMLVDCSHRVDLSTGEVEDPDETPCPYLAAKYKAMTSGRIVVCTAAYYFFAVLRSADDEPVDAVVFDEVHSLPKVIRGIMSYDITDLHLERGADILDETDKKAAAGLRKFATFMKRVVRRAPAGAETLLRSDSIKKLIDHLEAMRASNLYDRVVAKLSAGAIDSVKERETLVALERILRGIGRYLRSLRFAIPDGDRPALDYVFAYHSLEFDEKGEGETTKRVRHKLTVRGYYVAPLIRTLMGRSTLAYSATIGNPEVFGFESGIKLPFLALPSLFPPEHARIYLPTDAPDLSWKGKQRKGAEARAHRKVARMAKRFADSQVRSLILATSETERTRLRDVCVEEGVSVVTYESGAPAREALARFKTGEGDVLIGTIQNFGQGVDLPDEMAPVTVHLRPAYPPPDSPEAVFEEERFGDNRWRLNHWRVAIEAMQARGRNIRSASDRGVTIFVSTQFQRFLAGMLPKWLWPAYRDRFTLDECVDDALKLLRKK